MTSGEVFPCAPRASGEYQKVICTLPPSPMCSKRLWNDLQAFDVVGTSNAVLTTAGEKVQKLPQDVTLPCLACRKRNRCSYECRIGQDFFKADLVFHFISYEYFIRWRWVLLKLKARLPEPFCGMLCFVFMQLSCQVLSAKSPPPSPRSQSKIQTWGC